MFNDVKYFYEIDCPLRNYKWGSSTLSSAAAVAEVFFTEFPHLVSPTDLSHFLNYCTKNCYSIGDARITRIGQFNLMEMQWSVDNAKSRSHVGRMCKVSATNA
jgi:hypothetical protein